MADADPSPSLADMYISAARRFGVDNVREHQLDICLAYHQKKDAFLIAPTGFGKSLCYQLAPLVSHAINPQSNSRIIIIEPTNALIDDSIKKLAKYVPEFPAVHLTAATITKAKAASYIFTSPEMILGEIGRKEILTDVNFMETVTCLFVDEVHIVEQWGSSEKGVAFREQYARLGELRTFTSCPAVAMTATIHDDTIQYIKNSLNMTRCQVVKIDIEKKNISYHVIRTENNDLSNLDFLIELLKVHGDEMEKTLVFFTNRKTLVTAYAYIRKQIDQKVGDDHPILAMYTALSAVERKQAIIEDLNYNHGTTRVVLCTSSLAVGINIADVKYVIHYGAPTLTHDFIQETGRAARELTSHCHSLLITFPHMNPKGLSQKMKQFISGKDCRRRILLSEFGSTSSLSESSKCCDICNPALPYSFQTVVTGYFPSVQPPSASPSSSTEESMSPSSLSDLDWENWEAELF